LTFEKKTPVAKENFFRLYLKLVSAEDPCRRAIVTMNQLVPENVVIAGNPAKIIWKTEERDINFWSSEKQLYIDLAKKYLQMRMRRLPVLQLKFIC
jgi:hypothetical protein